MKILVVGIGGVGGFFGGLLAKEYINNETVKIYFLARGKHLEAIKQDGLKIIHRDTFFIAHPHMDSDSAQEIGPVDYVIICTKSYDLKAVCNQIKPCIKSKTILLPLLNGVNNSELIQKEFQSNLVLQGFVFIVSRILEEGQIENMGNVQSLYFGIKNGKSKQLEPFENILKKAGIEANLTENISALIWEKFIFLSSLASATSYYNCTIGDLLIHLEKKETLLGLVKEVINLSIQFGIKTKPSIFRLTIQKMEKIPPYLTSSMHRDFMNKKANTELEALTGFVVHEAKKKGLSTPIFDKIYQKLANQ